MICQILAHLPLSAVGAMEQVCRHLRTVIIHARFWRRILMHTVEWEPGLRDFLPDFSSLERQVWISKIKRHITVRCLDPNSL